MVRICQIVVGAARIPIRTDRDGICNDKTVTSSDEKETDSNRPRLRLGQQFVGRGLEQMTDQTFDFRVLEQLIHQFAAHHFIIARPRPGGRFQSIPGKSLHSD